MLIVLNLIQHRAFWLTLLDKVYGVVLSLAVRGLIENLRSKKTYPLVRSGVKIVSHNKNLSLLKMKGKLGI